MDRNTVIGLVLIGIILSVFTIVNQPSEEEIKEQQKKELALKAKENAKKKESTKDKKTAVAEVKVDKNFVPKKDAKGQQIKTDKGLVYVNTKTNEDTVITVKPSKESTPVAKEVKGELTRLETDKLIIDFSTKGGKVAAVYLKEYESYKDFAKKDNKITPLLLFDDGDAVNELVFTMKGKKIKTGNRLFTVKSQTKNSIVYELDLGDGKTIENQYTLKDKAFDLDYTVKMNGFGSDVNPKNVMFNWEAAFRKTERLFSEQRRVSTVCFNGKEEGLDYLNEMGDDDAEAEEDIQWVAFKQSYFSSIIRPEKEFAKEGTKFKVRKYADDHEKMWSHIKDFKATTNLNIDNVNGGSVKMNWYFGPNDYETLHAYDQGYDDILNFGWGLFRWINLYAVQPLFTFLSSTGMGMGIAILMLTIILKFILMPVQWKMFTSSAKMRILKPEIDELNAKYPNKEDAMKKQMEMMSLYRESGASPLAGCVPMLIQMPILLAVFRFFPSAFELRQKSFLWAEDLSSYDSVWDFGVNIWFYGDHMSLFALLMSVTTLVYTYLNSGNMQQQQQPGMPNMKVIMYIFPVMMIFFFNSYSSGLSYYYFISTLISILIMVMIKEFFVDENKLKAKMADRKANAAGGTTKVKKKSKFQERLEAMQKAQQEQLKNRKK